MHYQTSILRDLIYGAVAHGANFQKLCKRLDLTPEQLLDGEGRVPLESGEARDFWTEAVRLTGDTSLALHMGEKSDHTSFGMLGYLAKSCRTIGESIATIIKYNDTLSDVFKYSLEIGKTEAIIEFNPIAIWEKKYPQGAHQAVDMSLSSFVKAFYTLTGKRIYPRKVELRYPKRDIEEYERILKSPITFNSSRNCFVMSIEDIDTPIISYDQSLFSLFSSLLAQKQQLLNNGKSLTDRIRHLLLVHFKGHVPAVEIMASHLFMSARTLQRKLGEEKTTYRAISNQLRKELAGELLKTGNSKREDVATLLGYTDMNTFRKALRNWEQ